MAHGFLKHLGLPDPLAEVDENIRDGIYYTLMYCDRDKQTALIARNPIPGTPIMFLIDRLEAFFGHCGIDLS